MISDWQLKGGRGWSYNLLHSQDRKPQIGKSKGGRFMQDINTPRVNLYNPFHSIKSSPRHLAAALQGRKEDEFCLSCETTKAQGVGLSKVTQLLWEAQSSVHKVSVPRTTLRSVWGQAQISGAVGSQDNPAALGQQAEGLACPVHDPST